MVLRSKAIRDATVSNALDKWIAFTTATHPGLDPPLDAFATVHIDFVDTPHIPEVCFAACATGVHPDATTRSGVDQHERQLFAGRVVLSRRSVGGSIMSTTRRVGGDEAVTSDACGKECN